VTDHATMIAGPTDNRSPNERALEKLRSIVTADALPTPSELLMSHVASEHVLLLHGVPLRSVFELAIEALERRVAGELTIEALERRVAGDVHARMMPGGPL